MRGAGSRSRNWCGLAATAALLALPVRGQTTLVANNQLLIDPSLCVVAEGATSCTVPLRVRWLLVASETETVCLFATTQPQPLFCVHPDSAGERQLPLPLPQDTRFELRRQHDHQLLAFTTVTVAKPLSDLRPRRRHGWGIF